MTAPVILCGYAGGLLGPLAAFLLESSVVFVEEPDVVRKRNIRGITAGAPLLREIVEWEYQREGAADAFYHRHRDLAPQAVVPISDYSVPFAARLAERYGVPGAGYGAAVLLRDKRLQRLVTTAAGIPNPPSVPVNGPDEVAAFLAETGGPIVLKPANRRASVGTRIVYAADEVAGAWVECTDQDEGVFAPDRPRALSMLAERYVRGDEYSVEMLVRDGRPVFGAPTRKYLHPGPRPVELGHVHPADIAPELARQLVDDTARVLDAFGMDTGIAHCEWIVENGQPYLVECGGRMAGDGIIELVLVAWQYDIVIEFFNAMRGLPMVEPPPEKAPLYCAAWLPAAPPGVVSTVDGVDQAKSMPGVHTCSVTVKVGDEVHPLRSSWDRAAMVTAEGATAAEAIDRARAAAETIVVTVA